jgi:hypothetical protein
MSNEWKAELVSNNIGIQSFWGGHAKILPRAWLMSKGMVRPEIPDSATWSSCDSHNLQIANRLELGNGPSESWESGLPD